jgi:ABC-type lipoprotein release transport system permease subunit
MAAGQVLVSAGGLMLESQLYDVSIIDRASWAAMLLLLSLAIGLAVLRPALSAARMNPADALRAE